MAEVILRNPGGKGNYKELALSQVFPSGWEIINTRLAGEDNVLMSSPFTWQDIRDDRVYTYFDLQEKGSVTYHVLLNAAYPGKYYQAPVYCEAMYDRSEEHTSELQSLMRISYAVFCLTQKNTTNNNKQ